MENNSEEKNVNNGSIEILESDSISNEQPVQENIVSEIQAPTEEPVQESVVSEIQTPVEQPIENIEVISASSEPAVENSIEIIGENASTMTDSGQINVDSKLNVSNGKSKTKTIIIIAVAALAVLIGGFFLFRSFFLLNKKTVIGAQVDTFFNMLTTSIDGIEKDILPINYSTESVGFEGKLNFSSNYKGSMGYYDIDLSNLEKYNLVYSGALDIKNNNMSLDASVNKDNEKLISLVSYVVGNVATFKSEELSYSTFKTTLPKEVKDINLDNTFNYTDLKTLIKKTSEIVKKSVNESNIVKENAKVSVNGKEISAVKFSYTYDLIDLENTIINAYKEDSEILSILAKISNSDESNVKDKLNKIDTSKSKKRYAKVTSYNDTLFGSVKKFEIIFNQEGEEKTVNASFDKLENKNAYSYVVTIDDDCTITGEINKDTKTVTLNLDSKKSDPMQWTHWGNQLGFETSRSLIFGLLEVHVLAL